MLNFKILAQAVQSLKFKLKLHRKTTQYLDYIKDKFTYPLNKDLIISEFLTQDHTNVIIIYLNGMVNIDYIQDYIIKPFKNDIQQRTDIKHMIDTDKIEVILDQNHLVESIVSGKTIILVEKTDEIIAVDTTKIAHRGVDKTIKENIIIGPQEGFVESAEINKSLIRKLVKDANLVAEQVTVGNTAKNTVNIIYIKNSVDENVLSELKKRLQRVKNHNILQVEILEQCIEDRKYSVLPSIFKTERPDRVASLLYDGRIALIMDGSSNALILPATFWTLFHAPDDIYQRWSYGNFIRFIRFIGILAALLTPALYVGITTYHPNMIPIDLLLAITAARERVPFPVAIEVLIMEISFELLREAATRVPAPLATTIGVIGALILGQASVEANIVSPILIIIVSITALSSFSIPDNSLNYAIRIGRFMFLILALSFGVIGIAIGILLVFSYLLQYKSFGVSFFSPLAPHSPNSNNFVYRPAIFKKLKGSNRSSDKINEKR